MNMYLLLLVRFIHGAAFGISTSALATVLMDIIPKERRGEGVGYFSLSGTLATSIGPFLGLFISQRADFSVIFIVCTHSFYGKCDHFIIFKNSTSSVVKDDQHNSIKRV